MRCCAVFARISDRAPNTKKAGVRNGSELPASPACGGSQSHSSAALNSAGNEVLRYNGIICQLFWQEPFSQELLFWLVLLF